MNFIIPYYCDERLKYTQKYLKKAGYNEVFDKSEANFAVLRQPATKKCLKGMKTCTYFTVSVIMIKNIKLLRLQ